jgi:hypothetical protein
MALRHYLPPHGSGLASPRLDEFNGQHGTTPADLADDGVSPSEPSRRITAASPMRLRTNCSRSMVSTH